MAVDEHPEWPIGRSRQHCQAVVGEQAVVAGRLEADGVCLRPQCVRDDRTILDQRADRLQPGEHALHGPAEAGWGGAGRAQGGGRRTDRRLTDHGTGPGQPSRRQGDSVGGHLADGRRAPDDHLPNGPGDVRSGPALELQELAGQEPLIDQDQSVGLHPERSAEARGRTLDQVRRRRRGRADPGQAAGRIQDRAGRLDRGLLQRGRGAHDRCCCLEHLCRQLSEEPAAAEVDRRRRLDPGRRSSRGRQLDQWRRLDRGRRVRSRCGR